MLAEGGNVNDYLSIASYFTISKFKDAKGKWPSGLYFNKVMFLTYQTLRNTINIKLPHCWYRYGDEVVKYSMPFNIKWDHNNPDKTRVIWKYDPPKFDDSHHIDLIEKKIDDLTAKYADDIFGLIRKVYSYAPFNFQKKFLEIREMFYGINNAFNWDAHTYATITAPVIQKAFSTFPSKNFPQLKKQKMIVEKAIDLILTSSDPDFNLVKDFSISFWFLFCYHLRTHGKAHENVPKELLPIWKGKIELENIKYRRILADLLNQLALLDDKVLDIDILKEEIEWKKKDDDEARNIIENFFKDTKNPKTNLESPNNT